MSESKPSPPGSASHDADALPQIDFVTFILSLATSALIQLGEHEDGTAGGPVNLPLAKQTIDMISMLREKTRGNLAPDETQHHRERPVQAAHALSGAQAPRRPSSDRFTLLHAASRRLATPRRRRRTASAKSQQDRSSSADPRLIAGPSYCSPRYSGAVVMALPGVHT